MSAPVPGRKRRCRCRRLVVAHLTACRQHFAAFSKTCRPRSAREESLDRVRSIFRVKSHRLPLVWVSAVLVAVAMALSACGGSSASPTASSSTTGATSSFSAYATCLSKHGLNFGAFGAGHRDSEGFPPGGFSSGGSFPGGAATGGGRPPSDSSALANESAACASLRPTGVALGEGGGFSAGLSAYRSGLARHGVKLPDNAATTALPTTLERGAPLGKGRSQPAPASCLLRATAQLRPRADATTLSIWDLALSWPGIGHWVATELHAV